MKAVFLGGGSLRLIPILRGLFADSPEFFAEGEIRLVDLNLSAADAVKTLLQRTPEFPAGCRITATDCADRAFEGCDVLYLTMAARSQPEETLAALSASDYGFLSSDQLSVNGAFLATRLGRLILSLAQKLEHLSPSALMLIFPNPVAVYSGMVNNYTKIRALGICGGFNNHRWDLSRLCGRDCFDPDWDVVAAGVNHLSFILRGSCRGRDIHDILKEVLSNDWKCMRISSAKNPETCRYIEEQLAVYVELYRRYGTLVFSTEGDGMTHLAYEWGLERAKKSLAAIRETFDPESAEQDEKTRRTELYRELHEAASGTNPPDWTTGGRHNLFSRSMTDISLPIFRALSGQEKMRITASRPNCGAVRGFDDRTVLEYTMDLFKDSITPVPDQYVPHPWQGLISSLAEYQTLLGDALAQYDPRLFAASLEAYPMNRGTSEKREFIRRMFDIYREMDPVFHSAEQYFR